MKTLLTILAIAFAFTAFADDLSEAKKAFATLQEYQKTDDERSPGLFAKDCVVTFVFTDGVKKKTAAVPMEAFIDSMKKQIAQKRGSTETYEDVKFAQEPAGIRVSAVLRYAKSGRKGPFSALYKRDPDGVYRIHEFNVTVYVNE